MCTNVPCCVVWVGQEEALIKPNAQQRKHSEVYRDTQSGGAGHTKRWGKVVEGILLKRKSKLQRFVFLDVKDAPYKHVPTYMQEYRALGPCPSIEKELPSSGPAGGSERGAFHFASHPRPASWTSVHSFCDL